MPIDEKKIHHLSSSADIPLGDPIKIYLIFVDMCKSTDFKAYCQDNTIPDGIWIERQLIFMHRIINIIQRFDGNVVKTIGDEVMGYFSKNVKPAKVLNCATNAHSLFRSISRYNNEIWKIKSKVSIDYGEAYDSNFGLLKSKTIDPIGLIVDRCARLNQEGKENEVVFSSSFFSLLESSSQAKFSKSKEEKELKGIGKSEFYRIIVD